VLLLLLLTMVIVLVLAVFLLFTWPLPAHCPVWQSIIGRGFAVHEREDDFGKGGTATSLSDGNAGTGVAVGVIGIKRV
jgi:hypothetical protein